MSSITNYRDAASKLDDGYFLGQVVSFTICEGDVDLSALHEQIEKLGLRDGVLKDRIRRVDAFKRAANDIATKFLKFNGQQNSILVRAVGQDAQESHRHVVLEEAIFRTGEERKVKYTPLFKLAYDRGQKDEEGQWVNDSIYCEDQGATSLLNDEGKKWIVEAVGDDGKELKARFTHYSTHIDSHAVRTFVRDYIRSLNGINIKGAHSGGLYFVHQKHAQELRDLATLIKDIGSEMHLIPLLDIVDQRDHIAQAFVDDTLEEIRALDAEIDAILSVPSRQISEKTYDAMISKALGLIEKNNEYKNLLDDSLDLADMQVNVFRERAMTLVTRIRYPKSMTR